MTGFIGVRHSCRPTECQKLPKGRTPTCPLKNLIPLVEVAHLGETAFELVGEGFQYIGTELGPGFVERHQSSAFAHAASARQVLMERYTCQSVVDGFQFRIVHVVIAIECRSEPMFLVERVLYVGR